MAGRIVDAAIAEKPNGVVERPNSVREQLESARQIIRAVAQGRKPMQLIGSEPGLGKTYITLQELRRLGIKVENVAPANGSAFVKTLFDHRNDEVLVLDDCDALARSEVVAGIAKMAWGPTRLVIRDTVEARKNALADESKHDPNIPPQRFKVRCRLIWLTNIDFTDPANVEKHMAPHFRAMCSRGLDPVWIDTSSIKDLFEYCVWLGTDGNMLRSLGMPKSVAEEAVAWFIENRNRLKEVSPRQLVRAARMIQGMEEDRGLLKTLLSAREERNLPGMRAPRIIGAGKWTGVMSGEGRV
jgi:hypothetical protein